MNDDSGPVTWEDGKFVPLTEERRQALLDRAASQAAHDNSPPEFRPPRTKFERKQWRKLHLTSARSATLWSGSFVILFMLLGAFVHVTFFVVAALVFSGFLHHAFKNRTYED